MANEIDDIGWYNVQFFYGRKAPETAELFFTTEANSYGLSYAYSRLDKGTWFDGKVQPYTLKKQTQHWIDITKVTAYEYLRSKCSNQSFYQWVSTRLVELSTTSRDRFNNQTCRMLSNVPCSSNVTLPSSDPFIDLPPCNSEAAADCYYLIVRDIFEDIFDESGSAMTAITCSIQEYELEDRATPTRIACTTTPGGG